jgi:hypothetical protein
MFKVFLKVILGSFFVLAVAAPIDAVAQPGSRVCGWLRIGVPQPFGVIAELREKDTGYSSNCTTMTDKLGSKIKKKFDKVDTAIGGEWKKVHKLGCKDTGQLLVGERVDICQGAPYGMKANYLYIIKPDPKTGKLIFDRKRKLKGLMGEVTDFFDKLGNEIVEVANQIAATANDVATTVVNEFKKLGCEVAVNAVLKGGAAAKRLADTLSPALKSVPSELAKQASQWGITKDGLKKGGKAYNQAVAYLNKYQKGPIGADLTRLHTHLTKNGKNVAKELFNSNFLCNMSEKARIGKMKKLGLKPAFIKADAGGGLLDGLFINSAHASSADRSWTSFSLTGGAQLLGGFDTGFIVATDWKDKAKWFYIIDVPFGAMAGAGASLSFTIYPSVSGSDFQGPGWGWFLSGGPVVVEGGVQIDLDEKFAFSGIGGLVGVGVGLPVASGFSWGYAVALN